MISCSLNDYYFGFIQNSPIVDQYFSFKVYCYFISQLENAPGKGRALDCGAGIGRITRYLLKRHYKNVDLVEQNKKFLEKATEILCQDGNNDTKHEFFCCGLQNFTPKPETYDLIWCQWVLGQLTDPHLIQFLERCK